MAGWYLYGILTLFKGNWQGGCYGNKRRVVFVVQIKRTPGPPLPPSRKMCEGGPRAFSLFEPVRQILDGVISQKWRELMVAKGFTGRVVHWECTKNPTRNASLR